MALFGKISEPQKITPVQEQSKQNTLNNPGKENLGDNLQENRKKYNIAY